MDQTTDTKNWREELAALGKEYFTIHEMIRMGFLKISLEEIKNLKLKFTQLNKVSSEIRKLSEELKGIEDITPIIKEIRKNRIERVRAARAIRKVEKKQLKDERDERIKQKNKNTPSYLGDDISKGLIYEGIDVEKLKTNHLPIIHNLSDLSEKTKLTREQLSWLSYHRKAALTDHYTRFQIPKRKGGMRSISSPKKTMRIAQDWVLTEILSKIPAHPKAMAFQEGKSTLDNAKIHLSAGIVIRIDLKDFFPSLKFNRIKGLFHSFGYSEGVSVILALLCTDSMRIGARLGDKEFFVALGERYLPQGACTSPAISNLVCRGLDNRLEKLAEKSGFIYSRYADDLVFSHPDKNIELKNLLGLVKKIIKEENFEINTEKTSMMRPHQRQSVTGVVINTGIPKISRSDIKRFRAFLHQFTLVGEVEMDKKMGKSSVQYAKGYLAYISMINAEQAEIFRKKYDWL